MAGMSTGPNSSDDVVVHNMLGAKHFILGDTRREVSFSQMGTTGYLPDNETDSVSAKDWNTKVLGHPVLDDINLSDMERNMLFLELSKVSVHPDNESDIFLAAARCLAHQRDAGEELDYAAAANIALAGVTRTELKLVVSN